MFKILLVTVITKHYFKLHQYETFATSLNRSKSMEEGLNIARIAKSCTENINGCQGVFSKRCHYYYCHNLSF